MAIWRGRSPNFIRCLIRIISIFISFYYIKKVKPKLCSYWADKTSFFVFKKSVINAFNRKTFFYKNRFNIIIISNFRLVFSSFPPYGKSFSIRNMILEKERQPVETYLPETRCQKKNIFFQIIQLLFKCHRI